MIKSAGRVDTNQIAKWLANIPLESWPQQHKLADGMIRPAMVTEPDWHGFAGVTKALEDEIIFKTFPDKRITWRALSILMPNHCIPSHADQQPENWFCRLHIPLLTNKNAYFVYEEIVYRMEAGQMYPVDTRNWHSCVNAGLSPRIHLLLDLVKCG